MTKIVWDQIGARTFESGLDRGVLYFPEGGGVAWNGLTSVTPNITNTTESVYYDGIKVGDVPNVGDFQANMKAYTFPDEFLQYEGVYESPNGSYIFMQHPKTFHLSYRTGIGNDVNASSLGYKIHLLWNLLAVPVAPAYGSLSLDPSPLQFEWNLTSVPDEIDLYAPSSYLAIDSRNVTSGVLTALELILYGTTGVAPKMPSIKSVLALS